MRIKFSKMQGCGNDYVYVDCNENTELIQKYFGNARRNFGDSVKKLSDRRYGIGGDGVILICPSEVADCKMRIFNADGTEGKVCGNGIRCVAAFLMDKGKFKGKNIKIETLSGVKTLGFLDFSSGVYHFEVNMGKPEFLPQKIPVDIGGEKVFLKDATVKGKEYKISCVSMGNPHCIIFCDEVWQKDIASVGRDFQASSLFPEGINVEFVEVLNNSEISMRVWERGSGETLACGTGACASVVSAVECGFCEKGEDIDVNLRGGKLKIKYDSEGTVWMTGPAQKVFEGEIEID